MKNNMRKHKMLRDDMEGYHIVASLNGLSPSIIGKNSD